MCVGVVLPKVTCYCDLLHALCSETDTESESKLALVEGGHLGLEMLLLLARCLDVAAIVVEILRERERERRGGGQGREVHFLGQSA